MDAYSLTIEESPSPQDIAAMNQILFDYNRENGGEERYRLLTVALRDASGKIAGGIRGATYWGWLYVDMLAVAGSARRQGYGSRLLRLAEAEALRRGCTKAYLDTFDFQALPFYRKHGYSVFGTLNDFPKGHTRYFLTKSLITSQVGGAD